MTSIRSAPVGEQVKPGTSDQHLLDYISSKNFGRVLLVTGHRSFSWFDDKGFVDKISEIAETMRWSDVHPNPEFLNLKEGLEVVSSFNPDVIIGVGGGSVLDMAKLLGALHQRESSEVDAITTGSVDFRARKVRLVLVPTTAGSGAEATHFSVLYREAVKHSIAGKSLLPDHILLDSALVTTGEPLQLAASGLDALCQCIESIWARDATSESREKAIAGLRKVVSSLIGFVQGDASLAGDIQLGSHLGGQAINISKTTAPHALSYFLTIRLGVPHGIAVASTIGYFIDHHTGSSKPNFSPNKKLGAKLDIIRETLALGEGGSATEYFEALFKRLGLNEPRSYWPRDADAVAAWVDSANHERLRNHPVLLGKKDLFQVLRLGW